MESKNVISSVFRGLQRALVAVLMVCLMYILFQEILIFPALTASLFVSKERLPETLPNGVKSHFVRTSDGETLEVWALKATPQPQPGTPVGKIALLFHGNGETVENVYPVQRWLLALGIASYSFDYRGFGKSSGWPSEDGLYLDAKAVWEFIEREESLTPKDLIVYATSIGTGPGAWLAQEYQVGTLVLMAPFTSLIDVIKGQFFVSLLRDFSWYQFPVGDYVAKLETTCLVVAAGRSDSVIPFELSKQVVDRYRGSGKRHTIFSDSAGHNNLLLTVHQELGPVINGCPAQYPVQ